MMKAKYRDRGTEGGKDRDRQDKAFALKAKGPTEKDAWSKPAMDNWIVYYIIKDE